MAKAPSRPQRPKRGDAPPQPRRRGGEARRLADLLPSVGDASLRKFGFIQGSLVSRWQDIVGSRIAAMALPQSIAFPPGKKAGGTLTIAVVGAHGPVVQLVAPDVMARVNRFFGYGVVARIKLVPGAAARAEPPPPPPTLAPVATEALSPDLRGIADPELRAVLEGLAASLAKRGDIPRIR